MKELQAKRERRKTEKSLKTITDWNVQKRKPAFIV